MSDKVKLIGVAISAVIAIGAVVYASIDRRDAKVEADILLVNTVSNNVSRLSENDGKWDTHKNRDEDRREKQAVRDAGQDDEIEAVQSTHKALLEATRRTEINQHDLRTQMEAGFREGHKFQLEQVKAIGELTGHIKSITEVTEVR